MFIHLNVDKDMIDVKLLVLYSIDFFSQTNNF